MGWVRGQTYQDTYAPALPRKVLRFVAFMATIFIENTPRQFSVQLAIGLMNLMIQCGGMFVYLKNFLLWCVQWPKKFTQA
jgi:hypothetical protein